MSDARRRLRRAAVLAGLALAGCASWRVEDGPRPAPEGRPQRIADRVLLEVDERLVPWGDGELGEGLRQGLLELGSFDAIDYPVVPRDAPPLRLRVEAEGRVREQVAPGVAKAIFVGLLLFLPAGVVTFDKDYDVALTAELSLDGRALQRVAAQATERLRFTMFADRDGGERRVRERAFQQLATELALRLQPVAPPR